MIFDLLLLGYTTLAVFTAVVWSVGTSPYMVVAMTNVLETLLFSLTYFMWKSWMIEKDGNPNL